VLSFFALFNTIVK